MNNTPNIMLSTSVYGFENEISQICALLKFRLQRVEFASGHHQSELCTVQFGELPEGGRGLRFVPGHHPHTMRYGLHKQLYKEIQRNNVRTPTNI